MPIVGGWVSCCVQVEVRGTRQCLDGRNSAARERESVKEAVEVGKAKASTGWKKSPDGLPSNFSLTVCSAVFPACPTIHIHRFDCLISVCRFVCSRPSSREEGVENGRRADGRVYSGQRGTTGTLF